MTGRAAQQHKAKQTAARMAEIRKARRDAGFSEVTIWVPEEKIKLVRDYAWSLIDKARRVFPHRMRGPGSRRERRRK